MSPVIVYTKPACMQCVATKRALDRDSIPHHDIDVSLDPEALRYVQQELGYGSAPVVVAGDDHWSGFRPDRISALAKP